MMERVYCAACDALVTVQMPRGMKPEAKVSPDWIAHTQTPEHRTGLKVLLSHPPLDS